VAQEARNRVFPYRSEEAVLVLSRHLNEEIVIAGTIRVKIVEITGSRVRLGIEAPQEVPVVRLEAMNSRPQHIREILPLVNFMRKAG